MFQESYRLLFFDHQSEIKQFNDFSVTVAHSRPADTEKIFCRGMVVGGTHTRSITNRPRNNVWVDATVNCDFEGHFKVHKTQIDICRYILFIMLYYCYLFS